MKENEIITQERAKKQLGSQDSQQDLQVQPQAKRYTGSRTSTPVAEY